MAERGVSDAMAVLSLSEKKQNWYIGNNIFWIEACFICWDEMEYSDRLEHVTRFEEAIKTVPLCNVNEVYALVGVEKRLDKNGHHWKDHNMICLLEWSGSKESKSDVSKRVTDLCYELKGCFFDVCVTPELNPKEKTDFLFNNTVWRLQGTYNTVHDLC